MGICFSDTNQSSSGPPTAKVVSDNGDLREYHLPISVTQVLQAETTTSTSTSSSPSPFFVCNSDFLSFDEYIPELNPSVYLKPDQIYFVLPKSKLEHKLTANEMAAMAVKASVALQNLSKESSRRKKNRISPVVLVNECEENDELTNGVDEVKSSEKTVDSRVRSGRGISRTGSVKRLQKVRSKRAQWAVRSFRLRLSTIYEEGFVLDLD